MTKPTVLGLRRIWNALWYSMAGFKACFIHEQAFRQEIYAAVPLLPLGLWLGQDGTERALLVGSLLLVLIVEPLCTSGLPSLYTRILTLRSLDPLHYYGYIGLYIAMYMIDDVALLAIGVVTLSQKRLQEKEGRMLKLVSGVIMVLLGIYLILMPR